MTSGIYAITNTINGFMYIGQSINVGRRWIDHIKTSIKGDNKAIYQAIEKDGIENFSFKILELCPIEELDEKEKYYISLYRTYIGFKDCKGYNMTIGGKGVITSKEEEIFKKYSIVIPINKTLFSIKNSMKVYIYLKNKAEYNIEDDCRVLKLSNLDRKQMAIELKMSLVSVYRKIEQLESIGYIKIETVGSVKHMYFPLIEGFYTILNTSYEYSKNILSLASEDVLRVFIFHKSFGEKEITYTPTLQYIAECIGYSPTHLQKIIDANNILEEMGIIKIKKEYKKVNEQVHERNHYKYLKKHWGEQG